MISWSQSVLFNQFLSTWQFISMVGLFCHFCPYTFSSPGRGAPEPWTTWRSKVPSLLDHPQWSPFLQQRIFTAAWVKATTFKCPHFCTELIHRVLLTQSKAKVQVLHSSFFWKSATILQLLHPWWCNEGFPCFTPFNLCRVYGGVYHRFLLWACKLLWDTEWDLFLLTLD